MKVGQPPAMGPDRVGEGIASGKFATVASADLDQIIGGYKRGFTQALRKLKSGTLALGCNWGDEAAPILAEMIGRIAKHHAGSAWPFQFAGDNLAEVCKKKLRESPKCTAR